MDKPNGTYALGVFCTFVRPYVSGESRGISTQKKGFMKDFFDVILESSATDTSDVNKRHYSKAKTAINEGVWAGINQTDLVKFFNGCRKLPQWKASEFFQHWIRPEWKACLTILVLTRYRSFSVVSVR